ncbi:MAG: hypothetical protein ACJAS3_000203 [Roseivirga sp.]|jgi:hypothetical protein
MIIITMENAQYQVIVTDEKLALQVNHPSGQYEQIPRRFQRKKAKIIIEENRNLQSIKE